MISGGVSQNSTVCAIIWPSASKDVLVAASSFGLKSKSSLGTQSISFHSCNCRLISYLNIYLDPNAINLRLASIAMLGLDSVLFEGAVDAAF